MIPSPSPLIPPDEKVGFGNIMLKCVFLFCATNLMAGLHFKCTNIIDLKAKLLGGTIQLTWLPSSPASSVRIRMADFDVNFGTSHALNGLVWPIRLMSDPTSWSSPLHSKARPHTLHLLSYLCNWKTTFHSHIPCSPS